MDEVLFAYIAVAPHTVSLVLIWVYGGIQRPVYYVSRSLHEAEIRYLPLEKAILAVVHATRKLHHYFQAHTIVVLTQLPLRALLQSADYTGKVAKWGTILGVLTSSTCLVPLLKVRSSQIWWLSLLKPCMRARYKHNTWMENRLGQLSHKNHYIGSYILMEQRIKEDPEWG